MSRQFKVFPQNLSYLFNTGWVSGELINEFKLKLGAYLHKQKIPKFLLGQIVYAYFNETVPRTLHQNHFKDYYSTYFVFDAFSHSDLKRILKKMKKDGYLKLR
ncbi:MAG: hypothetical protein GY765_38965 [bacterium]|nr:hypothetical protein [bacterium]